MRRRLAPFSALAAAVAALPLITAYALAATRPRKHKRLYEQREALLLSLEREFERAGARKRI